MENWKCDSRPHGARQLGQLDILGRRDRLIQEPSLTRYKPR